MKVQVSQRQKKVTYTHSRLRDRALVAGGLKDPWTETVHLLTISIELTQEEKKIIKERGLGDVTLFKYEEYVGSWQLAVLPEISLKESQPVTIRTLLSFNPFILLFDKQPSMIGFAHQLRDNYIPAFKNLIVNTKDVDDFTIEV